MDSFNSNTKCGRPCKKRSKPGTGRGVMGRQGVINGHQFDSPAPKRKNERKKRPTNQKMQSTADKHALTRSFLNGWAIPGDLDYSYLPRILGLEMNFVRGVCKHLSLGNIFLIHSRLYF